MFENEPTKEELLYFGDNEPAVTKHTFLHQILRSNYKECFYKNCYELRLFEHNSFYLKLVKDLSNL